LVEVPVDDYRSAQGAILQLERFERDRFVRMLQNRTDS